MKSKIYLGILAFLILTASAPAAFAKYNPAKDNPYIRLGNDNSKKWYEFYKKEKTSAYVTKNSGYWYSAKQENVFVRGAKTVAGGIKEIVQSAL